MCGTSTLDGSMAKGLGWVVPQIYKHIITYIYIYIIIIIIYVIPKILYSDLVGVFVSSFGSYIII